MLSFQVDVRGRHAPYGRLIAVCHLLGSPAGPESGFISVSRMEARKPPCAYLLRFKAFQAVLSGSGAETGCIQRGFAGVGSMLGMAKIMGAAAVIDLAAAHGGPFNIARPAMSGRFAQAGKLLIRWQARGFFVGLLLLALILMLRGCALLGGVGLLVFFVFFVLFGLMFVLFVVVLVLFMLVLVLFMLVLGVDGGYIA